MHFGTICISKLYLGYFPLGGYVLGHPLFEGVYLRISPYIRDKAVLLRSLFLQGRLVIYISLGDMASLWWGMHFNASRDYMHLGAISPHTPLAGYGTPSMGYAFICISGLYASRGYIPSEDMEPFLGVLIMYYPFEGIIFL